MKKVLFVLLAVLVLLTSAVAFAEAADEPAQGIITEWDEDVIYVELWVNDIFLGKAENVDELNKLIVTKKLCEYENGVTAREYRDADDTHAKPWYVIDVLVIDHNWVLISDTATCTEDGIKTYKCTVCGKEKTEKSPKLGHLWSSDVEAPDQWGRITKNATCTEEGEAEDYCLRCGIAGKKTRVIEKPEHIYEGIEIDQIPDCAGPYWEDDEVELHKVYDGKWHNVCIFCGDDKLNDEGEIDYQRLTLEDYNDMVYTEKWDSTIEEYVEYDGHTWDGWITEFPRDCYEDGQVVHFCTVCGLDEHHSTPKLNHSINPHDREDWSALELVEEHLVDCFHRYDIFECQLCGDTFYGMFDMDGNFTQLEEADLTNPDKLCPTESHVYKYTKDYLVEQVEPTCTEDGYRTYKCIYHDDVDGHNEEIGDDYVQIIDPALGHDWTAWVCEHTVGAGENAYGHWVRKCNRCGLIEDANATADPNTCDGTTHNKMITFEVAASCEADGYQDWECKVCHATGKDILPATGHFWGAGVETAASCTTAGGTTYTCGICGATKTEAGDPATGHTWEIEAIVEESCANGGVEGVYKKTCSVCGAVEFETKPAPAHTIVIDEAVAPEDGKTGLTEGSHCSVCGEIIVAQEEIAATEYTVEAEGNKGTITAAEGCIALDAPYVRIVWNATLVNGDEIGVKMCAPVKADGTFKLSGVTLPAGSTINWIYVEVVDDPASAKADTGSGYTSYGANFF